MYVLNLYKIEVIDILVWLVVENIIIVKLFVMVVFIDFK